MKDISRPIYLNHIISLLNRGMMLILTGQRRVGKSFILRQLHNWLLANNPEANVVYINKELHTFGHIKTDTDLYEAVDAKFSTGKNNYLLIDEVQDIVNYETALRSFYAEEKCQIVATGSNAYIFSSEISTRLAGRYIEIPIYSLGYEEFLEFHGLDDCDSSLIDYLRVGGLPGLCHFDIWDEAQLRDYLQGVYNTVMMRDVISRESIRNIPLIENLAKFVADNIGKLVSVANITKTLDSNGEKSSAPAVSSYLKFLCNALIINPVARFDIHGKRLFEQNFKYFFADHGLRNLICGFNIRGSIERLIENVIYHHLLIQGYKVTVGILRAGEVDFVATKNDTTIYIQATYLLGSEETVKREFGNLAAIKDNYAKYVVSMDPVPGNISDYPGIRHVHLREFLKLHL